LRRSRTAFARRCFDSPDLAGSSGTGGSDFDMVIAELERIHFKAKERSESMFPLLTFR